MVCTKHGVHGELGEICPECVSEEIRAIRAEEAADMLPEQEQASGTDVLPSDCSGCPLYRAENESGVVSVGLTRAEVAWLQDVSRHSPYGDKGNMRIAERIADKLRRVSK